MHRDQRAAHDASSRGASASTSRSCSRRSTATCRSTPAPSAHRRRRRSAASSGWQPAADPADQLARTPRELLDRRRRRRAERRRSRAASASGSSASGGEVDLVLDRLVPRDDSAAPSTSSASTSDEAVARRPRSTVRRCTWRKRTRTSARGPAPGRRCTSVRHARALRARRLGVAHGARARRTASASGSSAPTPGTGTARSPRRARRRRPRGRRGTGHRVGAGAESLTPSSPASFSSRSTASSHVGSARAALKRGQRVERVAAARASSRCWGSRGPSSRATPRPAAGTTPRRPTRPAPTDEARLALGERGAREQQDERDLAVVEGVEVLRRRDLEVVGARHGQVDLGRAVEPGDGRRDVGPQERPQGVAPLRRLAEQLDEPLLLVVRRSAAAAARSGSGSAARPRGPAPAVGSVMRSRRT